MGCDIHAFAEVRRGNAWASTEGEVWDFRSYAFFGWLADVRNYSSVAPLAARRGLPRDVSPSTRRHGDDWDSDGHSHSWVGLSELLAVDYGAVVEDRRYSKQVAPNHWDGGATCAVGEGKATTLRELLPASYFETLENLKELGAPDDVRVVFWFDN